MSIHEALAEKLFIRQKELAKLVGANPATVSKYLKQKGVELTPFGYSTSEVIKALNF